MSIDNTADIDDKSDSESAPGSASTGDSLTVVGIGPGAREHMTAAALHAIEEAEVVVGYTTYLKLIADLLEGKEIVRAGMTEEIGRARSAVERAKDGAKVAVISSGDAGVYGMGALIYEVLKETGWQEGQSPSMRLIPGVTAINACAALVGAPLGHDFCAISLSDLLTPWEVIERRIEAAAYGDFVVGLYNPASGRRKRQIVRAQEILSTARRPETPVALVKSAYRKRERVDITDLAHMLDYEIGMLTTVLVGSSQSYLFEGRIVTPRGYHNKYTWEGATLPGQIPARSLVPTGTTES